jgi:hypothetical protein
MSDRHAPKPTFKTCLTLLRWYVYAFLYRLVRRWL